MVRHTTAALCARHASSVTFWVALTLALALAALHPAMIWANGGTGITILQPAGGVYMSGTNLTVSFNTDAALYANTPLDVSFVAVPGGVVSPTTYTIISATVTRYTANIPVPKLPPGEYILVIQGQEINSGSLTSAPFTIVAATPTPLPSLTPSPVPTPAASQAHQVPSRPSVSGGVIAAAAAGTLLALSLALLTVPPLRRRRNRPPR